MGWISDVTFAGKNFVVIILSLLTNNSGSGWAEQLSSEGQLLVQGPALLTLVEQKGQKY